MSADLTSCQHPLFFNRFILKETVSCRGLNYGGVSAVVIRYRTFSMFCVSVNNASL